MYMKTNVVYKKIVLIRLCENCRADGVICMLYETWTWKVEDF